MSVGYETPELKRSFRGGGVMIKTKPSHDSADCFRGLGRNTPEGTVQLPMPYVIGPHPWAGGREGNTYGAYH